LNASTVRHFGIEKAVVEPSFARRLGYRLLGEIHISGRIRLHHVLRTIASLRLPDSGVQMLDAGTGRGDLALHFSRLKRGWCVRGVDIDQERVDHCRAAARALEIDNVKFDRLDLLDLESSGQYNLISSTDVLEHIEDDRRALANMARALKPGGYLVLTFPSDPGRHHLRLLTWVERRKGLARGVFGHVREGYSPEGIRDLLEEVRLETVLVRSTYGFFGTLAHDIFFIIGDSEVNPFVFGLALPFLLALSFIEGHTSTRHGSALLVVAKRK
jgi:SAM-dependent methyltransferase